MTPGGVSLTYRGVWGPSFLFARRPADPPNGRPAFCRDVMNEILLVGIAIGMVLEFIIERAVLPRLARALARHGWR